MELHNISIVGPMGAFINHLRWLVLLDPSFSFKIPDFNLESYNNLKGESWPSYENYLSNNLTDIEDSIKNEITDLGGYYNFSDLSSKLKFLSTNVYPTTRSWDNWLITEWRFRSKLDQFVNIRHKLDSSVYKKNILLTIDPELAYRSYLKLNSSLNRATIAGFKREISDSNKLFNKLLTEPSYKILSADVLFQPNLDRNFYNELTDWLGLSDTYQEANYIHEIWYNCHKQAEKDFLNEITKIYENA